MRVAVFYATREGHACQIAEHLAWSLSTAHVFVDLYDLKTSSEPIAWSRYAKAFVVASVHIGHHEPEAIRFATKNRRELERVSAAFLSVTLSQAGAQDARTSEGRRAQAAADAVRMIEVFVAETGWRPARALPVAGALAYSKYNFIVRFVMKRIARKAGAPTDASRDYDFTDWDAVERFAGETIYPPPAPEAERRLQTAS